MTVHPIDPRNFRDALGHYPSGITIITGIVDSAPVGFTCQSFYSVSIDPPLISFSVMKTSSSWPKIRPVGKCAINILSCDQVELSNTFGGPSKDRWTNVRWSTIGYGNPIIDSALVSLDCSLYAEHEAGDHIIVVCRVDHISASPRPSHRSPLVYFRGSYRRLVPSIELGEDAHGA